MFLAKKLPIPRLKKFANWVKNEITLATWHQQMLGIFPNIKEGDNLSGYYRPNQAITFFNGTEAIGTIVDPAFSKWFFRIWLDPNTDHPEVRAGLLGEDHAR